MPLDDRLTTILLATWRGRQIWAAQDSAGCAMTLRDVAVVHPGGALHAEHASGDALPAQNCRARAPKSKKRPIGPGGKYVRHRRIAKCGASGLGGRALTRSRVAPSEVFHFVSTF